MFPWEKSIVMFESPIVAHRCSACRAAFRRAADEALMSMGIAERKRGMSVSVRGSDINHRHTRTGFANARHGVELRKRKRRASVLVCGSKQGYDWPESNSNLEALEIRHIIGGVQWED